MTLFVSTNKASTSGYNKESPSNKGSTFSLSNSFKSLNDENLIIKEVATGSMATTLEKVDYLDNLGSNDEVEPVKNEMASFLVSKPMGVGYGLKNLLKQWREINVDYDYDPYDDDMYEGQEIPNNIQTICDDLDIKKKEKRWCRNVKRNGDVIKDGYAVEKPAENEINPQGARNKSGVKGARRESGREIELQARSKPSKKY
ncbi:hypothetical protein Tco_0643796 [Tanacetum coccineum]